MTEPGVPLLGIDVFIVFSKRVPGEAKLALAINDQLEQLGLKPLESTDRKPDARNSIDPPIIKSDFAVHDQLGPFDPEREVECPELKLQCGRFMAIHHEKCVVEVITHHRL